MSFSYNFGANPPIDYPRLLISDTQDLNHIFEDAEITAVTAMQALQYQSGMFYTAPAGANLPLAPVSYLRVAATLLMALAANKSRLASIKQILDVRLDSSDAADQLRKTAESYLDIDDNAGAMAIIEMCNDQFSFVDRYWKQVQRQQVC